MMQFKPFLTALKIYSFILMLHIVQSSQWADQIGPEPGPNLKMQARTRPEPESNLKM